MATKFLPKIVGIWLKMSRKSPKIRNFGPTRFFHQKMLKKFHNSFFRGPFSRNFGTQPGAQNRQKSGPGLKRSVPSVVSSRFFCVFSAIARIGRCSHRLGVRFGTLRPPESVVNTMVSAHFRVFRKRPKNPKFPPGNLTFFGRSGSKRPPKKTRGPPGGFFWSILGVLVESKKKGKFEANF